MRKSRVSFGVSVRTLSLAFCWAALLAPAAMAEVTSIGLMEGLTYQQTSTAQPSTASGGFGMVDMFDDLFEDATTRKVTTTSPLSPMALSLDGSDAFLGALTSTTRSSYRDNFRTETSNRPKRRSSATFLQAVRINSRSAGER